MLTTEQKLQALVDAIMFNRKKRGKLGILMESAIATEDNRIIYRQFRKNLEVRSRPAKALVERTWAVDDALGIERVKPGCHYGKKEELCAPFG